MHLILYLDSTLLMNNQGPPDAPIFNTFHLTQAINVRVIVSWKNSFHAAHCFSVWSSSFERDTRSTSPSNYTLHVVWTLIWCFCVYFIMSAVDISGPFRPSAHQRIHIFVSTKLWFQATLRRIFGEARLVVINASVDPFILPTFFYQFSLDVYIFVLI